MNARHQAIQAKAIIALYRANQSYSNIARKMGLGVETVRTIMEQHAPELIRRSVKAQVEVRSSESLVNELTLGSLGLHDIGRCASCGCAMVSRTREKGQSCGLCVEFAARAA